MYVSAASIASSRDLIAEPGASCSPSKLKYQAVGQRLAALHETREVSRAASSRFHFLVALPTVRDLSLCAKHLFVEARTAWDGACARRRRVPDA
jgi:hypothetical protein